MRARESNSDTIGDESLGTGERVVGRTTGSLDEDSQVDAMGGGRLGAVLGNTSCFLAEVLVIEPGVEGGPYGVRSPKLLGDRGHVSK